MRLTLIDVGPFSSTTIVLSVSLFFERALAALDLAHFLPPPSSFSLLNISDDVLLFFVASPESFTSSLSSLSPDCLEAENVILPDRLSDTRTPQSSPSPELETATPPSDVAEDGTGKVRNRVDILPAKDDDDDDNDVVLSFLDTGAPTPTPNTP